MTITFDYEAAKKAAHLAGEVLKSHMAESSIDALKEEGRDIKLQADFAAEQSIIDYLKANSSYPILSEESGWDGEDEAGYKWIVDPLDGTLNFSRRVPLSCVSVALWRGDTPVIGVVYDFIHDQLYSGIVGMGAWLNERPIAVSKISSTSNAILATGFPVFRDFGSKAVSEFVGRIQQYKKVRLFGSAAMSLALVASGSVDAYREDGIMLWDVAAGIAIVKAAGGVADFERCGHKWQYNVACAASIELLTEGGGSE